MDTAEKLQRLMHPTCAEDYGLSVSLSKILNLGDNVNAKLFFDAFNSTQKVKEKEEKTIRTEQMVANVTAELLVAMHKFPSFHSAHEGYAVILEELDEAWEEIKVNDLKRAREEMIQVCAMALRFLIDIPATED